MTGHAGADRGTLMLPEVGDEVAIRFEEGDPERPYILGSVWNGVHQPPSQGFWDGGTNGSEFTSNNIKRLVTKSGHRITMVDTPGQETIAMTTPSSNRLVMTEKTNETGRPAIALETTGDIILSAPNGRIHFQSKLQSKEVGGGGNGSAVSSATAVVSASPSLAGLSCSQKMQKAISKAPLAAGVLNALGGPKGIAIALATMAAVWGVSQVTPAGWAADIAGALLVVGLVVSGSEIASGLKGLYDFWQFTCKQAQSEADLDHAGKLFADSVAKVGVNTLLAVLDAKALGRLKGATPPVEEEVPPGRFRTPDASVLADTEISHIKPVQVRPGTNGKVAVIGRSMNDAVNPYAKGLSEQGYDVETFNGKQVSESAQSQWNNLKNDYAPNLIPNDQVVSSQMFQENQAWANKLASQGYTVVDTGNPTGLGDSPFYNMEKQTLFGK